MFLLPKTPWYCTVNFCVIPFKNRLLYWDIYIHTARTRVDLNILSLSKPVSHITIDVIFPLHHKKKTGYCWYKCGFSLRDICMSSRHPVGCYGRPVLSITCMQISTSDSALYSISRRIWTPRLQILVKSLDETATLSCYVFAVSV